MGIDEVIKEVDRKY